MLPRQPQRQKEQILTGRSASTAQSAGSCPAPDRPLPGLHQQQPPRVSRHTLSQPECTNVSLASARYDKPPGQLRVEPMMIRCNQLASAAETFQGNPQARKDCLGAGELSFARARATYHPELRVLVRHYRQLNSAGWQRMQP